MYVLISYWPFTINWTFFECIYARKFLPTMGLDVAESSCCWLFIMAYLPTRGHLTRWPILALTIMTEGMAVSKKRCWLHASSGLRDSLPSLRDMMLSAFRYTSMHMKPLSLEKKKHHCATYITYISDGLGWVSEVGFWDISTTQNRSAQLAMNPIFWLNSGYIPQNSTLGTKSITTGWSIWYCPILNEDCGNFSQIS